MRTTRRASASVLLNYEYPSIQYVHVLVTYIYVTCTHARCTADHIDQNLKFYTRNLPVRYGIYYDFIYFLIYTGTVDDIVG